MQAIPCCRNPQNRESRYMHDVPCKVQPKSQFHLELTIRSFGDNHIHAIA